MTNKWMLGTALAALIAAGPAVAQTESEFGECALDGMTNERFTALDADRNGELSMDEHRACLEQAGIELDETTTATFESQFTEADTDGNETLAYAEIEGFATANAEGEVGEPGRPQGTIVVTQPAADVTVQQPAPQVDVTQRAPEVAVETAQPQVAVETPQPEVNVTQPEPQVAVEQGQPEVQVEQPEAQVAINQPEPQVNVQPGQPAVDVDAAQPRVAVETPNPEVAVEQPELAVDVEQQQPDVAVQQAQPEVEVQQAAEAEARVTEEENAAATQQTPPAGQQTAAVAEETTSETAVASGNGEMNYQIRVDDIVNQDVYNSAGEDIGEVTNVVLDPTTNTPMVVVSMGGFLGLGSREIAFPYNELNVTGERIVLNTAMSQDEIEQMPQYDQAQFEELPENMIVR